MPRRPARQRAPGAAAPLTDNEGSVLALILRRQPVTAYQLVKIHERSPVSSFNESKGSVYPVIARLKARALVLAEPVDGDGRKAELLRCSDAGREAVRDWVLDVSPGDVLLFDPLRTKLMSLDLLARDEQIEWAVDLKRFIADKIAEVEAYDRTVTVPFQPVVRASTIGPLQAKSAWLDELIHLLVKGPQPTAADEGRGRPPPPAQ